MALVPWYTSNSLISAIKRKISLPISQNTFSEQDILAFANEEMMISQVPSVMMYHEEYFVVTEYVPLRANVVRYPIPDRAIGMKLRDIFWADEQNNLVEMTRVDSDDRAFWQRNIGSDTAIQKIYLEGNDVVLTPFTAAAPTGSLVFVYFLRPNQLVPDDEAAIISSFSKTITVDNTTLISGDTVTINDTVFTAGTDFAIGGTSVITATNLSNAIAAAMVVYSASNGSPSTAVVTLNYLDLSIEFSVSNSAAFSLQSTQGITFTSVPTTFTSGSVVDFLETKAGHRTRAWSKTIPSGGVSGNTISFTATDVPVDLIVGDYVCLENECIIPQIPTDLHNGLAERACARILAAIGDAAGLANINQKIGEINNAQGTLLDSRIDGAPQKVTSRHSLLRYGKSNGRRFL